MDIKGARILITGGSSGIGRATAKLLKAQGGNVMICGRDGDKLEEAARELGVAFSVADVSNENDVSSLFKQVQETFGGLDVLVNNAGRGYSAALVDTSIAEFTGIWETNVKGALLCAQAAAKIFKTQQKGNIINVASTAASKGYAGGSSYVSSKFALHGLTECWRAELRKDNVRVMQVNPSEVVTNFGNAMGHKQEKSERKLQAEEIAHVILSMLTMNDRGFVTEATVWATNP